jgi:hypothetical protein
MGSLIEFNDTLKLKPENGMPTNPQIGETYRFHLKDERLYHRAPLRVFLVSEINEKWKFIGHAIVLEQTINSETHSTSGVFKITKLYDEEYARIVTINESPPGKSFY